MEIVRTILPHDLHEIDGKLKYFDNNALVPQVPLCEALNSTSDLIYQMLVSRGNVTAEDIRDIADWVFALAVELKWIPKPFDPDEDLPTEEGRYWEASDDMGWLGYDLVEPAYREEFISLIHEKLNSFEPVDRVTGIPSGEAAQDDPNEHDQKSSVDDVPECARPTAGELIDGWRERHGHTLETLAEQAGISIATLYRIRSGKLRYARQKESLKAVASVIGCEWHELVPLQRR